MKQLLAIFVAIFALYGCKGPMDGGWEAPKLDKNELHFAAEGGEQTVTILNYSQWWIAYGYEGTEFVDGILRYKNFVRATSSNEDVITYDLLDGGWYHAVVPNGGYSNQIIITTDENNSDSSRQATIEMSVGNAGSYINIYQATQK